MSGIQLVGNANNATAVEVELNTKAARAVIRPDDYGSLGIYGVAGASGIVAAGLGAGNRIYSFRNPSANLIVVKKVLFSAGNTATAFTAGVCTFKLFAARSFTVADTTNGTDLTPAGASNTGKLRTSMATSGMAGTNNIYILSTSTSGLTGGTLTADAQALASISTGIVATAGSVIIPPGTPLFDQRVGEYPLVCAQNEGFIIQGTVPATGTWTFSVGTIWEELASY